MKPGENTRNTSAYDGMPADIACIGECMVELSRTGGPKSQKTTYRRDFAGDTFNTAVYLSRLLNGHSASISYITAIGEDVISDEMLDAFAREHIATDHVVRVPDKSPGLYMIHTDESGERSFSYWRSNSAAKQLFARQGLSLNALKEIAVSFRYIYLSGITLAILDSDSQRRLFTFLQQAQRHGATVVFDTNYRPALWPSVEKACAVYDKMLQATDTALLTFSDEQTLYGDSTPEATLQRLKHISEIVVKNGPGDCVVRFHGETLHVPARKLEAVLDTTAAGDSFNAAYLAGRLTGMTAEESVMLAHRIAATVTQHRGAIVPSGVIEPLPVPVAVQA